MYLGLKWNNVVADVRIVTMSFRPNLGSIPAVILPIIFNYKCLRKYLSLVLK